MKKAINRISVLLAGCAAFLIPIQAFAASDDQTMREKLGFAAQNTVIGIVTVFCMLLLMALVIYLFRFLPKLVGLFQRKDRSGQEQEAERAQEASQPVFEQTAASAGPGGTAAAPASSPADDAELVAVITAAIAAARAEEAQAPVGSFVVRTIKKRN